MDKLEVIVETSDIETGSIDNAAPAKKVFVTPEISVPVDVLEATTFFQAVDSGATN